MTITRLLIVLTAISLSVASVQAQSHQSEDFVPSARKFDFKKLQGVQPPATYNFSLPNVTPRVATLNPEVAPTCYAMRTYVVNNDLDKKFVLKAGPDEVAYTPDNEGSPLASNYTTCQPSSQFAIKKAIQPVEIGNDGK